MKTTKLILVTALMVFATIGFAQAEKNIKKEPPPAQKSALIMLEEAVQNQGLKMAIYNQVTPQMITKTIPYFVAQVRYDHRVYNVAGTYAAWRAFFSMRPVANKKES